MAKQGRLYRLEGVVLGRRDQGEADRVITLLSPEGRADLLAKGVRKPQSRKTGHLELFSRSRLLVARVAGSWDIVSQAEAVEVRERLQQDFVRGTLARYVAELALQLFESDADSAVFELVDSVLAQLDGDEGGELLIRWYEQQVLGLAGFRPEWSFCVGEGEQGVCRAPLRPRPQDRHVYGLDPANGGALCPGCLEKQRQEGFVRHISPSVLSWLQALQRQPYADLAQYALPERSRRELGQAMEHYIAYHLERRPNVLRLLRDELRR